MRKQQEVWKKEHSTSATLPSLGSEEASKNVVYFIEHLKKQGIKPGKCIDIGCGKGRNSIYLAKQGFEVYALDYVEEAIEKVKEKATKASLLEKIHLKVGPIDEAWNFENDFFDFAIDNFSSIDIETKEGREKYRDEMFRTLKPGGCALVCVVSASDEIEREFIASNPGPEKNSVIWPDNGKFQKNYDEQELREFYSKFDILELEEVKSPAVKLGKQITATNYRMILQKSI